MRVTIDHREEAGGISGARRRYYVDCTVQFSEEERAVIKARDLYNHLIRIDAATPPPSKAAYVGTGFIRVAGRLLIVGGVVLGFADAFARFGAEGLSFLMVLVGIGLEIYGWRRGRKQDKRIEQIGQEITLRQLISNPRFTVYATDPANAKQIEEEIRAALVTIKQAITHSTELGTRQSFEI